MTKDLFPDHSAEEKNGPQHRDQTSDQRTLTEEPPSPRRSKLRTICIILICTSANLINISNVATVAISLPTIGKELEIPQNRLQWITSTYALSSGCLLLLFGRLADLYGRKYTFIGGSLLMLVFSLGCGFAQGDIALDVLRGLQGVGAAATIPASLGILAHAFPPSRTRSIAFATFSAGAPIGAGLGTTLGAVLTEFTSQTWRSTFYFTTGITALCMVGGILAIDPDLPSTETDRRLDWIGAALISIGLVLVVFVLSQGEIAAQKWKTPYIIALLIVGFFFVGIFLAWQQYLERVQNNSRASFSRWTPPPLMKLSLWSRGKGRFAVVMLIAILNWAGFISWIFWAQLYYQSYLGLSPVRTMVRLLPMFITGIICNFIIALVVGRVPLVILITAGTLLTSSACLLFALINTSSVYWAFGFPAAICSVIGADFVFAAGTIFVAKIAFPHEQSLAGGLFQTMTQLGTSLGLAVTTVVFNRVMQHDSAQPGMGREAQLNAYKAAQWTTFGFGALATLLGIVFLRGVGIVGGKEKVTAVLLEPGEQDIIKRPVEKVAE